MRTKIRVRGSQAGTQLLEFALIMPVLVLLFFVVTEGSALIRAHQVLNNAAREGARFSTSQGGRSGDIAEIQTRTKAYITAETTKVDVASVTVAVDQHVWVTNPATGTQMETSVVTVSYPYTLSYLPAFSGGLISPTVNLSAKAQFRNLW